MNLPIIQSILYGALRPNMVLSQEEAFPYKDLANAFAKTPDILSQLERYCLIHLSKYAQFDFDNERPFCLNNISSGQGYTKIIVPVFQPNIELDIPQPKTPFERFYYNVVQTESKRIKLALLNYSEVCRSDTDTRCCVKETLRYTRMYALTCRDNNNETEDRASGIYAVLKVMLIKLYCEITLMFLQILKEADYVSFEDLMFECNGQYPDETEQHNYDIAVFVQTAQIAIETKLNVDQLLSDSYSLFNNNGNKPLTETFIAIENYVFRQQSEFDFKELKQNMLDAISDMTNSREILNKLEAAKESLSFFEENQAAVNSTPRQYLKFLNEQIKLCKDNYANPLMPVSKNTKRQDNLKPKVNKKTLQQQLKIAQKRINFMSGYNIYNQRIMTADNYNLLVNLLDDFLKNSTIPKLERKIHPNMSAEDIRYTFYLLYKDLNVKSPSRRAWVEFIHAVFDKFDGTVQDTTYQKFSKKPKSYDNDWKQLI